MQSGASYNHQTVMLDGESFSDCAFAACRLVYSEEAAAQTLSYLKLMWSVGAKPAVQTMIKEITVAGR
jgi:hypothetical protein